MDNRLELQAKLEAVIGNKNVYLQKFKMEVKLGASTQK